MVFHTCFAWTLQNHLRSSVHKMRKVNWTCVYDFDPFRNFLNKRECNKTHSPGTGKSVKNERHNHFSQSDNMKVKQASCLLTAAFSTFYGFCETRIWAMKHETLKGNANVMMCHVSFVGKALKLRRENSNNMKEKHLQGINVSNPRCVVINRKRKLRRFIELCSTRKM